MKPKRWFEAPPGIQWATLFDFARWPITIASIVALLYVATLVIIALTGTLTLDLAFSAGQVFTGLAGIGVAVVAIAGIAKQFESRAPLLVITTEPDPFHGLMADSPLRTFVFTVTNAGNEAAHQLTCTVLGHSGARFKVSAQPPWRHEQATRNAVVLSLPQDLPPQSAALPFLVSVTRPGAIDLYASCWNGRQAYWYDEVRPLDPGSPP